MHAYEHTQPFVQGETTQSEIQSQHQDIANLAYALWQRRGCGDGSPEQDWFEAELKVRMVGQRL
jgi:hypothetical protein